MNLILFSFLTHLITLWSLRKEVMELALTTLSGQLVSITSIRVDESCNLCCSFNSSCCQDNCSWDPLILSFLSNLYPLIWRNEFGVVDDNKSFCDIKNFDILLIYKMFQNFFVVPKPSQDLLVYREAFACLSRTRVNFSISASQK